MPVDDTKLKASLEQLKDISFDTQNELFNDILNHKHHELSQEQLTEFIGAVIKQFPLFPYYIKDKNIQVPLHLAILANYPEHIKNIPSPMQTRKMWEDAIRKNFMLCRDIPEKYLDAKNPKNEIILDELSYIIKEGLLWLLPNALKTSELCLQVLQTSPKQIGEVPKHLFENEAFISNPIVIQSIKQQRKKIIENWENIKDMPSVVIDLETAIAAANQNWQALNYIPAEIYQSKPDAFATSIQSFITHIKNNVEYGVLSAINVITVIPIHFRTREVCLAAASKHTQALQHFPQKIMTYEFIQDCIKQDTFFLVFFDLSMLNHYQKTTALNQSQYHQICIQFLKRNRSHDKFFTIPISNRTYAFCAQLLEETGSDFLKYIQDFKNNSSLTKEEYKSLILKAIELVKEGESHKLIGYFNTEVLDFKVWHALVKKDPFALQCLDSTLEKTIFSEDEVQQLFRTALQVNGNAIKHVPVQQRSFPICSIAVWSKPDALVNLIDFKNQSMLREEEFLGICKEAVQKDGLALRHIPYQYFSYSLCELAVQNEGRALEYVSAFFKQDTTHRMTEGEYKQLCLKALESSADACDFMPQHYLNYDFIKGPIAANGMLMKSIQEGLKTGKLPAETFSEEEIRRLYDSAFLQNVEVISFMPLEMHSYRHYEIAVSREGTALKFIYQTAAWQALDEAQKLALSVKAVQQNAMALEYVDDRIKKQIIDQVTAQKIIAQDYQAIDFFPKESRYEQEIDALLKEIENVIVTKGANHDREIRDTCRIYAEHPKRQGKTIHVDSNTKLDRLLTHIKINQSKNPKPINLILLGHTTSSSTAVNGIDSKHICNLLVEHEHVDKITLLSCHSGQAKSLESEKLFREERKKNGSANKIGKQCGMLVMSQRPEESRFNKLFQYIDTDKKGNRSSEGLILIKEGTKDKPEYTLLHLKQQEDHSFSAQWHTLDNEQFTQLVRLIGNVKKQSFPFPNSKKPGQDFSVYRGGQKSEYLDLNQIEKLMAVVTRQFAPFSRRHKQYKEAKKQYPFLTSGKIGEEERDKLLDSLMFLFVSAIRSDERITRPIEVKGYPNVMMVDLKEEGLKAGSYAYVSEYSNNKSPMKFFKAEDNIRREEMDEFYRKKITKKSSSPEQDGEGTSFKSIRYRTPGK